MSDETISPVFEFHFSADSQYEHDKVYVPVSIAELTGRTAISLLELTNLSFRRIPEEFAEERQRAAVSLNRIERCDVPYLRVLGPDEGDYYIELPSEEENAPMVKESRG